MRRVVLGLCRRQSRSLMCLRTPHDGSLAVNHQIARSTRLRISDALFPQSESAKPLTRSPGPSLPVAASILKLWTRTQGAPSGGTAPPTGPVLQTPMSDRISDCAGRINPHRFRWIRWPQEILGRAWVGLECLLDSDTHPLCFQPASLRCSDRSK